MIDDPENGDRQADALDESDAAPDKPAALQAATEPELPLREISDEELKEILAEHEVWQKTDGKEGLRANLGFTNLKGRKLSGLGFCKAIFVGANLEGAVLGGAGLSEVDFTVASLHEADLRGADLRAAILSGAKLTKANLTSANLQEAIFVGAYLTKANLTGANLQEAMFVMASLDKTNLAGANLKDTLFRNSDLTNANLTGATLSDTKFDGSCLRDVILGGNSLGDLNLDRVNLRGTNLSGVHLARSLLNDACLVDADLSGADLEDVGFSGADFTNADLSDARLNHAHLEESKLIGAKLDGANVADATLTHAELIMASLINANFSGADLHEANLTDANLTNANLTGANLSGAILRGVNLAGVRLDGANLSGVDLRGLNLTGAKLEGANLSGADLKSSNLTGASLDRANLSGANLKSSNLTGASLERADLSGAYLQKTDLSDAIVHHVRLHKTDLSTTQGLEGPKLGGADLRDAKLPNQLADFKDLGHIADLSRHARNVFLSVIGACLYSWLTIATVTDAALVLNSTSDPLPIIGASLPIVGFFLVMPLILLVLYVYLQLYLARMWRALAGLPAIFPDGRTLEERAYPWLLTSLLSRYMPLLADDPQPFSAIPYWLSVLAAWWLVPATVFLFYWRYLTLQDLLGTALLGAVFVAVAFIGNLYFKLTVTALRIEKFEDLDKKDRWPDIIMLTFIAALVATSLAVTSPREALFRPDLRGADLSAATTLKQSQLDRSSCDALTLVPNGFSKNECLGNAQTSGNRAASSHR